jgi:hypothetical protein
VAHRLHDLRCPVGFTGTRQASAPAPSLRWELGPLCRCPDRSPESPRSKIVPSFLGTLHDFANGSLLDTVK